MKRPIASVAAACALAAHAATTVNADLGVSVEDPCRQEVSRFERAIGFVRQNQGNEAAQALKQKLLPADLENELLMKEGYCGLARYIREKKLHR